MILTDEKMVLTMIYLASPVEQCPSIDGYVASRSTFVSYVWKCCRVCIVYHMIAVSCDWALIAAGFTFQERCFQVTQTTDSCLLPLIYVPWERRIVPFCCGIAHILSSMWCNGCIRVLLLQATISVVSFVMWCDSSEKKICVYISDLLLVCFTLIISAMCNNSPILIMDQREY
jgi:hypothetical protein